MTLNSWLEYPSDHDFSIHNLPFGVYLKNGIPSPGIAIGDAIIDLRLAYEHGLLEGTGIDPTVLNRPVLNDFIAQGKKITSAVRKRIQDALCDDQSILFKHQAAILTHRLQADMCLPVHIGDYTDFYSSEEHATNVGKMFRDPANALLPNWKHIPVGYHGRASSVVVSGTPIHRPKGQTTAPDADMPVFGPSKRLDIELEMAFIIGKDTSLGDSVSVDQADDYIFGFTLFNDWSARDIQTWEYVPLGPFLAKNFASTMSPWIVTLEALEPFRTEGPVQSPDPLPYLKSDQPLTPPNLNILLEVSLKPEKDQDTIICRSNYKYMYWSMRQQLAHHTCNGCNIRVGDVMASGTISGPDKGSFGSMLEISWGGKEPLTLQNGEQRTFLQDGDSITIRGYAHNGDVRVGFGLCEGTILPAK
jgi:fumarylacetoacetase